MEAIPNVQDGRVHLALLSGQPINLSLTVAHFTMKSSVNCDGKISVFVKVRWISILFADYPISYLLL